MAGILRGGGEADTRERLPPAGGSRSGGRARHGGPASARVLPESRLTSKEAAGIAWEKARLICIAADFTRYDLHAVRLQRYPVDLLRYRCFASGHFGLEAAVSSEGLSRPASGRRVRRRGPRSAGNRMAELAAAVDETLRGLGENVSVVQRKQYRAYRRVRNFACLCPPQSFQVVVYLGVCPDVVELVPGFTRDVRLLGHHGTGDLEVGDQLMRERRGWQW